MSMEELSNFAGVDFRNARGIQWAGGSQASVIFYNRPVHNAAKSAEQGTPIYEDRVYVKIQQPGERDNADVPAEDKHRRAFPMQWHQFQQHQQQTPEGTPIAALFPAHPSIVAMLQASNVHTVQQLAGLSGNAIENIGMGAQRYVNAAQKYLEVVEKGVSGSQLQRELDERDGQIRVLSGQVETLKEEIARLRANSTGAVTLEQVQALLAGAQQRPTFPGGSSGGPGGAFDAATAQINATHPTREIAAERQQPVAKARAGRAGNKP
jgi:hypothetical protein